MKKKSLVLLGCTGSIGLQSLEIIKMFPEEFELFAIAAEGNHYEKMKKIITDFKVPKIFVKNRDTAKKLQQQFPEREIFSDTEFLKNICADQKNDIVINAISTSTGVFWSKFSLENGKKLLLANKESLVISGKKLLQIAKKTGAEIIPIDSEQTALWKLLKGKNRKDLRTVFITCSGGPFCDGKIWPKEKLKKATVSQALSHPTWKMGTKISIDSATLMNKAFELIAVHRFFGIPKEKIKILIHKKSLVHAAIEMKNGEVFAQISEPDMKPFIAATLGKSEKNLKISCEKFDFKNKKFTFEKVDETRFPSLQFANKALEIGERKCAELCQKNDEAVEKFLNGKIDFLDIFEEIKKIF